MLKEGKVKYWNPDRMFGFLTGDCGTDIYFNYRALPEDIEPEVGQRVEYEATVGDRGPRAVRLVFP
jgi:CspA family cold shock protein